MKKLFKTLKTLFILFVVFMAGFCLGDSDFGEEKSEPGYDRGDYEHEYYSSDDLRYYDYCDDSGCYQYPEYEDEYYDFIYSDKASLFSKLGSAGELSGNILVVSIYADDRLTRWDENAEKTKNHSLQYLKIACD